MISRYEKPQDIEIIVLIFQIKFSSFWIFILNSFFNQYTDIIFIYLNVVKRIEFLAQLSSEKIVVMY